MEETLDSTFLAPPSKAITADREIKSMDLNDRLTKAVEVDHEFSATLEQVKAIIGEFLHHIRNLVKVTTSRRRSSGNITVTLHTEDSVSFQYSMSLEVRPNGTSYDLLNFTFCPFKQAGKLPLDISFSYGGTRNSCKTIEEFENVLVERAKDVSKSIKMILTLLE